MSIVSKSTSAEFGRPEGVCLAAARDLRTLVEVSRWRADEEAGQIAYTFLLDGEQEEIHYTYAELDQRAKDIAVELQRRGANGEPVLLVFNPGLDFVAALFGCLYAGAIAVPVYPPDPFRLERTLPRLHAIVKDAEARLLLSHDEILGERGGSVWQICGEGTIRLESIGRSRSTQWRSPPNDSEAPAVLQYTSGSTGTPKGVILTHRNLLYNFASMHAKLDVENAVAAVWLPPYHDMGLIGGVLLPLYSGRRMVLLSTMAFLQRPVRWLQAISRYRATTTGAPNFAYELCARKIKPAECEGLDLSSWVVTVTGAEPVRADTIDRFVEAFGPYGFRRETFYPAYGLAEATVIVSGGERTAPPIVRPFSEEGLENNRANIVPAGGPRTRRLVGCGHVMPGGEIVIADPESRRRLGQGEVGEIWVRSPGVGLGYWNRPEETAAVFRAHLAGDDTAAYLRTGDLGFLHHDELFVTGRQKELIILAGRNYYPQDLEQVVQKAHPAAKPDGGAAFSVEIDQEERLVVVQEVVRPKHYDLDEVVQTMRRELGETYEVAPHAIVLIGTGMVPKTSSGKTRRRACRDLFLAGELRPLAEWHVDAGSSGDGAAAVPQEPPQTELEQTLVRLYGDVLGVESISRNDDFFALGAQSLQAIQFVGQVNAELHIELPVHWVFEHSTVARLATAIEAAGASLAPKSAHGRATGATSTVDRAAGDGPWPLSFAQERLWLQEQLATDLPMANVPLTLRLHGQLDVARLETALAQIVARHEQLRANFVEKDGRLLQQINEQAEVALEQADLSSLAPEAREEQLERLKEELSRQRFDLGKGPLLHVTLVRLAEQEHELVLVAHHAVCDGWSLELVLRELAACYEACLRNEAPQLVSPAIRYTDYALWQREQLEGGTLAETLAYWKRRLEGMPTLLDLPSDRPRPTTPRYEPGGQAKRLSDTLRRSIEKIAAQRRATPFMVLLTAFEALLSRYSGSEDFCVATPAANRTRPELEGVVGCFVNTLALRCGVSGASTFDELLERTRTTLPEDFEHADLPFEKLVEALDPTRQAGRMPLAQVMFILQSPTATSGTMGETRLDHLEVDYTGLAAFDLALVMEPRGTEWQATLVYNRELFDDATVSRIFDSYVAALEQIARQVTTPIADLPIPAEAERRRVLVEWNATQRPLPSARRAHELFAAQAVRTPDAVAIVFEGRRLTYRELDVWANRLAHWLQRRGVGPETRVGLHLERSPEMVAAMLAVHKAGGAYVPLDPAYPRERLAAMIDDAQLQLVLSESATREGLPEVDVAVACWDTDTAAIEQQPCNPPPAKADGTQLAYILYTSGSTGKPKGVMVSQRSLVNFLTSMVEEPGIDADDVMLAVTTISFDIAALELLAPLTVGACVVVARREVAADGRALGALIREHRATVMQATPSTYRMLLASAWKPSADLRLLCGGEALAADLAEALLAGGGELWNLYGPTETTVWSTIQRIRDAEGSIPIGRPIANTQVYVVDAQDRPVPMGVAGELLIGGAGVAQGYWNRPELTEQQFLRDPFAETRDARLYRTGDRARWRSDGLLECLGRSDQQVKVRGFRVELGEIEAALSTLPEIAEAVVVAQSDASGEQALVAYLVPHEGKEASPETLRSALARTLPEYMIPSAYVSMERLPRTPASKIDRRGLPAAEQCRLTRTSTYEAPRTPLEERIAAHWAEVLRVERIGVNDNFFELGGHSLLAAQLYTRLRDETAVSVPLRMLFERPTVAGLAEAIVESRIDEMEESDTRDVSAMFDRLEEMSDEEARAWLEQHGDEG